MSKAPRCWHFWRKRYESGGKRFCDGCIKRHPMYGVWKWTGRKDRVSNSCDT